MWFQIVEVTPVLLSKIQTQTWKILKFVKLLKVKSKSWFQIVEDVPVLLSKIQTQTWKILKLVKLLNIESKSWFQIVKNIPVLFVEDSDANLEDP